MLNSRPFKLIIIPFLLNEEFSHHTKAQPVLMEWFFGGSTFCLVWVIFLFVCVCGLFFFLWWCFLLTTVDINELAGCSYVKHSGTCLKTKGIDLPLKYHLAWRRKCTALSHIVVKELRLLKNYFKSYYNKNLVNDTKVGSSEQDVMFCRSCSDKEGQCSIVLAHHESHFSHGLVHGQSTRFIT